MGEAKARLERLRETFLASAEQWMFPPSRWERDAVREILSLPVERAIRGAWCAETSFIRATAPPWHPDNPARGQCGTTSLVVQDLLGGDLLVADVTDNGEPDGVHYWNRFGTLDIDLTREQFGATHEIGAPKVVTRPPDGPRKGVQQYELLRSKVFSALGITG